MTSTHLNEHDANQGAQSSGEFLGMTGNCGWYLLGSGGATILMVVFLWGIFGVSLLLCLFAGLVLCAGSVAYVFALKNNKPEHYDSDYFEAALVEAGVVSFRFGPRDRRPVNPFSDASVEIARVRSQVTKTRSRDATSSGRRARGSAERTRAATSDAATSREESSAVRPKVEPVVARVDYDSLQEQLETTEEQWEDVLVVVGED